jgi:siroheme synthase
MGLGRLPELAAGLIGHGRATSTPAAVIANGTLPEQRVVVAPLDRIAEAAEDLAAPALVVVGDVVALSEALRGTLAFAA